MNRDRGRIKWTAMMLPEHVDLLRSWTAEDRLEPYTEADEWTLQEIDEQLRMAFHHQQQVRIRYWQAGQFRTEEGRILQINPTKQQLNVEGGNGQVNIPFTTIRQVELISYD